MGKNEGVTDEGRSGARRVRRPKDKDELFENLVQTEGIFDSYAHLMTLPPLWAFFGTGRNDSSIPRNRSIGKSSSMPAMNRLSMPSPP